MDNSTVAALVGICLAVVLVILIGRGRVRTIDRAGFVLRQEVPEEVRAAVERMLGSRVSLAYAKPADETDTDGAPVWLLDLEGYGSDDPRIYLLLYPLSGPVGGRAMLAPRGSRLVPDLIRRREAGLWARLEPAGRELQEAIAGTDRFLYVDPGGVPPAVVDGLVRVARAGLPGAVTGVGVEGGFLGVWAPGRLAPLLAAGPKARDAFGMTEGRSE